jgi:hypothetical protein
VELSNITTKIEKLNPKMNIFDVIDVEGDYVVFVGQLGQEDVPHYFVGNAKYGVIEASCSTYKETPRMLNIIAGKDEAVPPKKQLPIDFN